MHRLTLLLAFVAMLVPSTEAQAQDAGDLDVRSELRALVTEAEDAREHRTVVSDFLEREDVERVAEERGVDLERLKDGVATLGHGDASRLAERVQDVEDQLAGGDTLVITSTTIIIVLLVILIIAVA